MEIPRLDRYYRQLYNMNKELRKLEFMPGVQFTCEEPDQENYVFRFGGDIVEEHKAKEAEVKRLMDLIADITPKAAALADAYGAACPISTRFIQEMNR